MSRSLRTRPLTLYASRDSSQPSIPPVGGGGGGGNTDAGPSRSGRNRDGGNNWAQQTRDVQPQTYGGSAHYQAYASTRQAQHHGEGGGSASKSKRGNNQASVNATHKNSGGGGGGGGVGSNLKKRLSMRYAEPTHLGPGGFSAIPAVPEVPSMPSVLPGAPDLPPGMAMNFAGLSYSNINRQHADDDDAALDAAYGGLSQTGAGLGPGTGPGGAGYASQRPLPIMGDGFDQEHTGYNDAYAGIVGASAGASQASSRSAEENGYVRSKIGRPSGGAGAQAEDETFRNYQDFIRVSKEIGSLENDMLELKELLKEWNRVPRTLELEEMQGGITDPDLRRYSRSGRNSMLDLQQVYRAQLMSLWEGIEGSQKFLPYVPGRHLIAEASSFTELNAATYKPKQGVALFLLDDLLLVAVRKKRQMSARVRLVAERCFSLGEIIVIDLKDGGELTNAVKIKRGKETFVYRTERAEDKRALLNAFRKVAEELANKRRKESLAEAEARKRESTLVGGGAGAGGAMSRTTAGGRIHASTLLGPHGASSGTGENGSVLAAAAATAATEKKDPGRWINDFSDELAVAIALREWGDAVSMVEKGKGALSTYDVADPAHQSLSAKLAHHTSLLVAAITHDLSSPYLKKTSVVRNASYLLRLDKGEKAREIFLAARSELLRRRSRQIKFEGDVSLYISELALVHFTLVKNTSEWYMSAFKDNRMASGFVRWASAQIEAYAEIFRRQVYGVADQDPKVVSEAIEITKSSANQLKEVGLSFGFLLEDLLKPDGTDRPIPALTLTLADEPSEAATHRLSAQEIRRQSAMLHR